MGHDGDVTDQEELSIYMNMGLHLHILYACIDLDFRCIFSNQLSIVLQI